MKISQPLVVFDLETTGTWIEKDKIIEIGMIKYSPDGSTETYVKRVNPGMHIPESVSNITGIRDEDVKNEPPFSEVAREVIDFIGSCDIGGFSVERFDLPVLEREMINAGLKFERGEKRTLTAAYKFYCDKTLDNAHSALDDAKATLEILTGQVNKYGTPEEGIESLRGIDYERSLDYFDKERKFRWWNGQLYPMFGKHARRNSIRQIAEKDPGYLDWVLSKDFSEEVKTMIRNALSGTFPEPPIIKV